MFDFSFLEMLVVFVVALLVLGPERLPKVARHVGWWMGRIRSSVSSMRDELEREASIQEFRQATKDIEQSIGETVRTTKSSIESVAAEAKSDVVAPAPSSTDAAKQDSQ